MGYKVDISALKEEKEHILDKLRKVDMAAWAELDKKEALRLKLLRQKEVAKQSPHLRVFFEPNED